MKNLPLPRPDQIRSYLSNHGWTGEISPPSDVEIFTYREPSDDGEPITVFVPGSSSALFYPLRVKDVVVTVAGIEERAEEVVLDEILALSRDKTLGNNGPLTKSKESTNGCYPLSDKAVTDLHLLPQPEQIRSYLSNHGWTGEISPPSDVEIFTYRELSDDGEPITVFVPGSSNVLFYPLRVKDVVVTVAGMEERPEDAVRSDILAEKWDARATQTDRSGSKEPSADNVPATGKP